MLILKEKSAQQSSSSSMKVDDRTPIKLNFTRISPILILKLALVILGMSAAGLVSCGRIEGTALKTASSPLPGDLNPQTPIVKASPTKTPEPKKEKATLAPVLSTARSSPTFGEFLSEETILLATPTRLACLNGSGRMEIRSLRSDRLKLPMEYRVWLPPCYDEEPERRYPVLYMVHGQNYNEDQWDRLGIDETAASLIASGEIPPLIIVMPRDRNWGQPSEDMFGRVLVEELIPTIDADFRSLPDRENRAIGGLSRGAGWAVHLGLRDWQLFSTIGAHSLPVFWEDTSRVHGWLQEIPTNDLPRIFMDIGDHDRPEILASVRWFEEMLTKKNIPHEWFLFPGYHEEKYWQAHLADYLRWYSAGWAEN
jgi:enterochelin esterase-like enzyme